jgi:hypothetical protein
VATDNMHDLAAGSAVLGRLWPAATADCVTANSDGNEYADCHKYAHSHKHTHGDEYADGHKHTHGNEYADGHSSTDGSAINANRDTEYPRY